VFTCVWIFSFHSFKIYCSFYCCQHSPSTVLLLTYVQPQECKLGFFQFQLMEMSISQSCKQWRPMKNLSWHTCKLTDRTAVSTSWLLAMRNYSTTFRKSLNTSNTWKYTYHCTHKPLLLLLLLLLLQFCFTDIKTHTHTHTTVLLLFWNLSGTTRVSRYQKGKTRKVKTNLDLLEQEIVSGSDICWAICKFAPHPRQPHQHPTTQFFAGWMPFLPPNQQRQSTEDIKT